MVIVENSLRNLADKLIEEITNRIDPFETYTIIVPNLLLEQWFKAYWLQKSKNVLMNVRFKRLRPFLVEVFNNTGKKIITTDKLTIDIMKELLENRSNYPLIEKYLLGVNKVNSINLYDLSLNLSKLFITYEKEGFIPNGEQRLLLDNIKKNNSEYAFLSDILNNSPKTNSKFFVFGFRKIEDAYMKALKKMNCMIYLQENDKQNVINKANICSCASKEREIEYIHGEICKLLNNGEKVYDITVYAPNLKDYETIIKKVFSTGGNKNYPEVPYVIVNSNIDSTNASYAIDLLYNILYMNQLTRYDLLKLLTNTNIQKARNIDPSKIEIIMEALEQMNVYRDNLNSDEWLYGIKRLLIAKLIGDSSNIENKVIIGDEEYLPYGSIQMDDESIGILVSMINDINSFRNRFKGIDKYKTNDLVDLRKELDKWLFYSETEPNFYYHAAIKILDNMIEKGFAVPFEIVFLAMINASQTISIYPSNMVTGGVTFINYKEDSIISSKHMFLIGMSNNNLPRKNIKDELDLRSDVESITTIDRDTYKLLTNNADSIYVSYVNQNLQTLEEYNLSDLVLTDQDALESESDSLKYTKTLGLLENRNYNQLFTKREIEKKDYNIGLVKSKEDVYDDGNEILEKMEYPTSVKCKDISLFLKENFMFKMDKLFKEYDDSLENYRKEYEPLSLDPLIKSNITQSLLLKMIEKNNSQLSEEEVDEVINIFKLTHSYSYYCDSEDLHSLLLETKNYYDNLDKNISLGNPFELELVTNIDGIEYNWKLINNSEYIISVDEKNNITFNYARVKKIDSESKALDLYVISLANIANLCANYFDEVFTIYLGDKYSYSINCNQTIKILNNLYRMMFDYDDLKIRSLDVLKKDSFDDLIKNLNNDAWLYFNDKKLINARDSFGYIKEDYNSPNQILRNELIEFLKDNILYIVDKEAKEDNGNKTRRKEV